MQQLCPSHTCIEHATAMLLPFVPEKKGNHQRAPTHATSPAMIVTSTWKRVTMLDDCRRLKRRRLSSAPVLPHPTPPNQRQIPPSAILSCPPAPADGQRQHWHVQQLQAAAATWLLHTAARTRPWSRCCQPAQFYMNNFPRDKCCFLTSTPVAAMTARPLLTVMSWPAMQCSPSSSPAAATASVTSDTRSPAQQCAVSA